MKLSDFPQSVSVKTSKGWYNRPVTPEDTERRKEVIRKYWERQLRKANETP